MSRPQSPPSLHNLFNLRRRKPAMTDSPSPILQSFISKTLRVTASDTRVFVGELKCTDKDKNLILAQTHEYRYPSADELRCMEGEVDGGKLRVTLKSRYIGLIVVPGECIVRIEVEEGAGGGRRGCMVVDVERG